METKQEPLEQLAEIRSMMARSSRFLSLSGLSGVSAGLVGIFSSAYLYWYLGSTFYYPEYKNKIMENGSVKEDFVFFILSVAAITLFLALLTGSIMTFRKARKEGQVLWNATGRLLFFSLAIPLTTGGIFCLLLLYHGIIYLLPAASLVFYGLSLINASKYTFDDIRYLGISEIILGLLSAFIVGYGLLFWAIGFGVLHVLYGSIMYYKYER